MLPFLFFFFTLVELSAVDCPAGGSAALELRLGESDRIQLEVAGETPGQTTRVELGRREQ